MIQLLNAVKGASKDGNWNAALAVALMLPDIAGKADALAKKGTQHTYASWFDRYVATSYTFDDTGYIPVPYPSEEPPVRQKIVKLCGDDVYALRCAYLHEGKQETSGHPASKEFDSYIFVAPTTAGDMNIVDKTLELRVDNFCNYICEGVSLWLEQIKNDADKKGALKDQLHIYRRL